MTIRICPERDAPCPHGMGCPYNNDRYRCSLADSRAALAPQSPSPIADEVTDLPPWTETEAWLVGYIADLNRNPNRFAEEIWELEIVLNRLRAASLASPPKEAKAEHAGAEVRQMVPPDGWVLVPCEPTEAMLAAVWSVRASNGHQIAATCYEAMIAAAPQPSSVGGEREVDRFPKTLGLINAAIDRYVDALFTRQNGHLAESNAFSSICQALGRSPVDELSARQRAPGGSNE